ncbi:ABC transporter permease [Aureimonas populi]|uniref:ABC transporter permease n=1 Tax=Aureimonas populi TaxID=1701758 RepID=A0ABW5CFH3_9HYPH|nr:iron ABC transporter permease [Aureimonas populi]
MSPNAAARRPPLLLLVPALVVGAGLAVPLVYLVVRAFSAEWSAVQALIFRPYTATLLLNTLKLTAGVLATTTLIALPLAWLIVRSDLRHKKLLSILAVMPLAVPGYVMAYALIGLSGYYGFLNHFFGLTVPRLQGWAGATVALSLYTFPYVFLNLRAALLGLDPALEETARSLGRSQRATFFAVTLPHLVPALLSGWLVIGLYVLGDFGVVALMRYEVFSFAIYNQYAGAFDRFYAAWLSLMLMALTLGFLVAEGLALRGRRFSRVGTGVARRASLVPLGRWRPLAHAFLALVFAASLGLPLMVILFWFGFGAVEVDWALLRATALRTAGAALPGAVLAALLALPLVVLTVRYPSRTSWAIERLAYFGYAVPPLAFALAMVFFALGLAPFLYQTLPLLVASYALSFVALAMGPVRSALLQMGGRVEEAARVLGRGPASAFASVTLPLLSRSLVAGGMLVFILIVKELPITFLLAPTGYTTLSMNVFARTSEGMLLEAAPYALVTILFSSLFVGLILRYEGGRS